MRLTFLVQTEADGDIESTDRLLATDPQVDGGGGGVDGS